MSLCLSSSSVRSAACQRSAVSRRPAARVTALFGGRDSQSASERKKEEQMEAQRAILEERRAKRDAFLRGEGIVKGGRVGPRSKARTIEEFEPAPPPIPKSKKERAQEIAYDIEEDEEEAPKGNPLAGLFGGLFGKK